VFRRVARRLKTGQFLILPVQYPGQTELGGGRMVRLDGRTTGWLVKGDQVYPIGDLRQHMPVNCWCRPNEDGGVIVHNSLDLRELYERGERKFS
jgi:hypothetical protein